MKNLEKVWPLFSLKINTPKVQLRLLKDEELAELASGCAKEPLLEHNQLHFLQASWFLTKSPQLERDFIQFHWLKRANWKKDDWGLPLGIFTQNNLAAPIGVMELQAKDFLVLKTVSTGSWIFKKYRSRGFGTEARAGVLQLGFSELGALAAQSSADKDNMHSNGVSKNNGYKPNGIAITSSAAGERRELQSWLLQKEDFKVRDDISITGLDKSMFGL